MREQVDIFREKHTWSMTSLYVMTFGSFAGFAATFPLLIKDVYGGFDERPTRSRTRSRSARRLDRARGRGPDRPTASAAAG